MGLAFPVAAAAQAEAPELQANPLKDVPITGVIDGVGTITGMFTVEQFDVVNGRLVARGAFTGQVKNAAGNVLGTFTSFPLTLPVTNAQQGETCEILHLELGPLDLDLLGLVVHLDRVVLDITAQAGPGKLLGNLLCGIAHLLDDTNASPNAIAARLNQLLRELS
jgi:hypothetical protein